MSAHPPETSSRGQSTTHHARDQTLVPQSMTRRISNLLPSASRISLGGVRGNGQLATGDHPKLTFKWVRGDLIGKGSYGRVYLGLNATTGEIMAVKQVELPQTPSDKLNTRYHEVQEALKLESDVLRSLPEHPNIVQYLGIESTHEHISIFLEYVPGGSIGSCLHNHGRFDDNTTRSFTGQIVDGLVFLHSQGVIHRDLKADNILVDESGVCKISDFGISISTLDGEAKTGLRGTVYWMAPEIIDVQRSGKGRGYNAKVDIWSLGCVVYEMWTGVRPWHGMEPIQVMMKVAVEKRSPELPADLRIDEDGRRFTALCFIVEPQRRPSAAELRTHRYLDLPRRWVFNSSNISIRKKSVRKSKFAFPPGDIPPVPSLHPMEESTLRPNQRTLRPSASNARLNVPSQQGRQYSPDSRPPNSNDNGRHRRHISTPNFPDRNDGHNQRPVLDGPPIVVIKPVQNPFGRRESSSSRYSYEQTPRAASDQSSDRSSGKTRRKSFFVANPDDDTARSKAPFVYIPPELPPSPPPPPKTQSTYSLSPLPSLSHHRSQPSLKPNPSIRSEASSTSNYYSDDGSDNDSLWQKAPVQTSKRKSIIASKREAPWARPDLDTVYHKLDQFFPDHDIDQTIETPSIPDNSRKHGRRRTIRVVAQSAQEEARRSRAQQRRQTRLWDIHAEEVASSRHGHDAD